MPDPDINVGVGELSRQVRDVLSRFEGLATRLETNFVRVNEHTLYKELVTQQVLSLQEAVRNLASAERVRSIETEVASKASIIELAAVNKAIEELQDDKKWISRLVLGFIVLGVLGAVFAVYQVGSH